MRNNFKANVQSLAKKQKGFTLVEIAIVLVIIGLLLGGVLKGQEMINSAKIKSDTDTLVALQAGAYAYKDRIGEYPGDADGNGQLDGDEVAAAAAVAGDFFFDLADQGFIATQDPEVQHDAGAVYGVGFLASNGTADADLIILGANQVCIRDLSDAAIATGIDAKLDDGVLTTGKVQGATAANLTTICMEL